MLTRAGVAKRLGRSIATVRRMEGVDLHPLIDARGVHRFDASEVEQVAERGGDVPTPLPQVQGENDEASDERAGLARATDHADSLSRRLAASESQLALVKERVRGLESKNRDLRATAREALELVQTVLGDEMRVSLDRDHPFRPIVITRYAAS